MNAEDRVLLKEIKDDIQELKEDVKKHTEASIVNSRDLAWIKGGLKISFGAILSIVGYLVKGLIK